MATRIEITGDADAVIYEIGQLAAKHRDHGDAQTREELASSRLDLDRTRCELAEARAQIARNEAALWAMREKLKDSSTVAVNPVLPPEIGPATVECVSPEKQASQEGLPAREGSSPVDSGTVHGEAVPRTASDRREATEDTAEVSREPSDGEKEGAPEPESAPVLCLAPGCAEPGEINGCCVTHSGVGPNLRRHWKKVRAEAAAAPPSEKQLFSEVRE